MRNSLIRQAAPDTFPHRWGKASGLAVPSRVSLYERVGVFFRFAEHLSKPSPIHGGRPPAWRTVESVTGTVYSQGLVGHCEAFLPWMGEGLRLGCTVESVTV